MWHSIGKGVPFKTFDVKVQVQNVPDFDVKHFENYSFSYRTSQIFLTILLLYIGYSLQDSGAMQDH